MNLTKRRKTKMSENDAKKNKHRFKDIENRKETKFEENKNEGN